MFIVFKEFTKIFSSLAGVFKKCGKKIEDGVVSYAVEELSKDNKVLSVKDISGDNLGVSLNKLQGTSDKVYFFASLSNNYSLMKARVPIHK